MPRSGFRRRGARMRYATGAAESNDAAAGGGDSGDALPPPPIGMPFSRRGRRRRQAPGDTGSVLPKLLMKMFVYAVVIVAMKYGKKGGAGDSDNASASGSPTSRIVSKISSLLDDVLGKSGDQVRLPGTKTLRVGTDDGRAANVYVVPNFLLSDVATRWRDGALYEFKRSKGSIPDSHPLSSEVIKTLASSDVQRKFHALGIDNVEGDTVHIAPYSFILGEQDSKNDNGWKLIIPLSDADATIQFACTASNADKETGQNWCDNVQLLHNTAVIMEGAAKFEIKSSSGDENHYTYVGVLGTFQTKAKEEL